MNKAGGRVKDKMDSMIVAVVVDSVVAEVDAAETFNRLDVVGVDLMMTVVEAVDGVAIEVQTVVGVVVVAAVAVAVVEVEIVIIVIVAMIVEAEEIVAKVEVQNGIVAQGLHHQEDRHLLIK